MLGVVLSLDTTAPEIAPERVKALHALIEEPPVFPGPLLDFLIELSEYYFAPIGEVIRLALPALEKQAAQQLGQQGLLKAKELRTSGRLIQAVEVAACQSPPPLRGQAKAIFERLQGSKPVPISDLASTWKNARQAVKKLELLQLATVRQQAASLDPFLTEVQPDTPPELNDEQQAAVQRINQALDSEKSKSFLLDGVTASGKTEVYLHAIQHCLERGRSALILVPEIALTPQLVGRVKARLGNNIAIVHSALSAKNRDTMWRSLRSGDCRVAVGTRSALFAPVENLGLICVDEEHDGSFKQEEGVRYHARDMALLRAHRVNATCILGSATPSLRTEALVAAQRMTRLELRTRAHRSAVLPTVEIVDLKRMGGMTPVDAALSIPLYRALEKTLEANEQAILFLNRRGFAPSVVCGSCEHTATCPNCSVALTLHFRDGGRLRCHYCDYAIARPDRCQACQSAVLIEKGTGTERLEMSVREAFPKARIARLDRDVAAGTKSEAILQRVRDGEVDVLVGTQMVTKGHDLPRVTLVGIVNVDTSLSMPDFRAAERSFHLLVQAAGRAGRGARPGKVLVQTRQPSHHAIRHAATHDVRGFIQHELEERRAARYPPFAYLALVRFDAMDENTALREAQRHAQWARRAATPDVEILGPAPAPLARLRQRWRFHFLIRCSKRPPLRHTLKALTQLDCLARVRRIIDVDPINTM